MRLIPLVLLTLVVAVRADDAQNRALAYYRAWYTLTVENKPESAKMWFEGVRKMEGLSAERDGVAVLIEWVSLQGDTFKHSPALKLNAEQKAALK